MKQLRSSFLAAVFFLFLIVGVAAQKPTRLPRSTPEAEGVSSQGIINFLDAVGKSRHEFHSYMILRHGKVIAEGWWTPYGRDLRHSMYSVSKSFTATAVGYAISESKLRLTDKVISFFPADLPDTVRTYLSALTVRDLLMMSAGQDPDPTGAIVVRDSNWVKAFLSTPILYGPGSTFLYNSLASYMLSAIVQKVTGQKIYDYLKPRLFDQLGISNIDWETDGRGVNTGGWGLRLKTEDMAKFGQLFLSKGAWYGKQVVPRQWVEEASSMKIIQHPNLALSKRDSSDWEQGYCYQMWRCRYNAFRADGAFGQFIIVMPEQDAVVAITAETSDMQGEINLVWKYLLPSMKATPLSADKSNYQSMLRKSASLRLLPAIISNQTSPLLTSMKTYQLDANDQKLTALAININGNSCTMQLRTDSMDYKLAFLEGGWKYGVTNRPGPYLLSRAKNNRAGLPAFKIAGTYEWKDSNTLALTLRYIESPHTEKFICHFSGNELALEISNSVSPTEKTTVRGAISSSHAKSMTSR